MYNKIALIFFFISLFLYSCGGIESSNSSNKLQESNSLSSNDDADDIECFHYRKVIL